MNLKKKIGMVFMSKSVGTGPSSYAKRIYHAAASQRLRNTDLEGLSCWPTFVAVYYEVFCLLTDECCLLPSQVMIPQLNPPTKIVAVASPALFYQALPIQVCVASSIAAGWCHGWAETQLIHDTSQQQLGWILPDTVNTIKCSWR